LTFSVRRIQIHCRYFPRFLIHRHKLPSSRVFSTRSVSTTNGALGPWRRQADSVRQTGLESTIQEVLTVAESGYAGGTKIVGIRKFQLRTQIKLESALGGINLWNVVQCFCNSNRSWRRLPRWWA